MHVMIVACYHPLPLSACMLNFDLVSILFGTSSPYILQHFSENVFTLVSLVFTVCSQQLAVTPTSCLVRILHTEYNSGSSYGNS